MSDYYCEEHRYNPPLNSVLRFCPYCLGAEAPAPEADSTSETPLTDAVTTGSTGDLDFIYDLTFLCRQLERKFAQAKKRLIDAEEILGELASGYWRQTLNNIDDRPARPDWPMGELIQLYWGKHNQGEQP
jgi:hypothetical protein